MCQSPLHEFLQALPKCEHHVHIEGTLTPEMLFALAARNGIQLPTDDMAYTSPVSLAHRYEKFTSLDDFLHYFYIGSSVLLSVSDFELLTYSYLQRLSKQNVRHAEIYFDPQVHIARGVPYRTVIRGMAAARARAEHDFPEMSVALVPCLVRHFPVQAALDMVSEIGEMGHFADSTVAGLGMSGTEKGKHPQEFSSVYDALRQAGVERLSAHYGEEGPPEYVAAAVSHLGVERIDHGRRAAEDMSLMRQLAAAGTLLTMCPISNVVLGGVTAVQDLPVRDFLKASVVFSINSDDPAYFGADLSDNYCAVQEAFHLSLAEWETIAKGAVQGSWCSATRKRELMTMVDEVVVKWRKQGIEL